MREGAPHLFVSRRRSAGCENVVTFVVGRPGARHVDRRVDGGRTLERGSQHAVNGLGITD
jgi:hypothetical protein